LGPVNLDIFEPLVDLTLPRSLLLELRNWSMTMKNTSLDGMHALRARKEHAHGQTSVHVDSRFAEQ
jgi:hypothetical protein